MKVWIVTAFDFNDGFPVAVFSTEEAATKCAKKNNEREDTDYEFNVDELTLNEEY